MARPLNLLHLPLLGLFLRWRHARTSLQIVTLLVAALVVYDGLVGPQLAPRNLAGVVPWLLFRGLVVLALLLAGSIFCLICPFMLPRHLARRILQADRSWPRWLQGKWPAIALLLLFFYSYEAFDLWASPWLTAWLVVAFFAGAFAVDGLFRGAVFCKHLCPIGQFNFVNSLCSPLEVGVHRTEVCTTTCATKDCIMGRYSRPGFHPVQVTAGSRGTLAVPAGRRGTGALRGKLLQNGCELWLFQEQKLGNMDCTFCLDCVHACPHDNVGVFARVPALELLKDPRRAGIGRFSERADLATLVVLLVFASLLNAFGMVAPFYSFERWLAAALGNPPEPALLLLVFALGLVALPAVAVSLAAWTSRALAGARESVKSVATRYSYTLAPLGFGMWLAHYGFHFLTGGLTVVPVLQSLMSDLGWPILGEPLWGLGPLVPPAWILPLELLLLEMGLLATLAVQYRTAQRLNQGAAPARRAFLPWAVLALLIFAAGVWLLLQPMEMRGTFRVEALP